ncbi:hypothetical protein GGH92_009406, partial [Coemansia sp. RSA 2673]
RLSIGEAYLVRGYALSGGGRAVDRVEVSLDDGQTWDLASLYTMHARGSSGDSGGGNGQRNWASKQWAWVLWSYRIDRVPPNCAIACRAWDSGGNTRKPPPVHHTAAYSQNSP